MTLADGGRAVYRVGRHVDRLCGVQTLSTITMSCVGSTDGPYCISQKAFVWFEHRQSQWERKVCANSDTNI